MSDNIRIQEIKNILDSHDLINIASSPTRFTPSPESSIDVIVINKKNPELELSVIDMGFSDHLAQVVKINTSKGNRRNKIVVRRQLTNNNIEEFKTYYLRNNGTKYLITQM